MMTATGGGHLVKNEFIFYLRMSQLLFLQNTKNLVISVVVLQKTAKKCTKIQNARAQSLFCSLNLFFGVALVTVAVVVC